MYTQCPECNKSHTINVEKLRNSNGMISCEACSAMFDAVNTLKEGVAPDDIETDDFSLSLNDITASQQPSKHWKTGAGFLLLIFAFQVYFFEAYNLTQNTKLRPWLKKTCSIIPGCQLPDYQNRDEFSILNGSFEPINGHYIFKAAFINQAVFAQKQPSIKLTLLDFNGNTFASRIFHPKDYSTQAQALLEPNIAKQITLTIATPPSKMGGYHFELI